MTLLLALLFPATAEAATLSVCASCPYTTINAAVIAASSGDVIEVGPGTYEERLALDGVHLTLRSTGGPGATRIRGDRGDRPVIWIEGGAEVTVEGFTLGDNANRAFRVTGATATVRDVVVEDFSSSVTGVGMRIESGSDVVIEDSRFIDLSTTSSNGGAALRIDGGSTVVVRGTDIEGCIASNGPGAAIRLAGGSELDLTEVNLHANLADSHGGAVHVNDSDLRASATAFQGNEGVNGGAIHASAGSTVAISGSTFEGGAASVGGFVHMSGGTTGTFEDVVFEEGEASAAGGALFASGGTLSLLGVTLKDNTVPGADFGGGALRARDSVAVIIEGSTLTGNATQGRGGAIYSTHGATLSITGTVVEASFADIWGGAISHGTTADLEVVDSRFEGNHGRAGGGIDWWAGTTSGTMTVSGTLFVGNTSDDEGGAITGYQAGELLVLDSEFRDNEGSRHGALSTTGLSSLQVLRSTFCENVASSHGGAAGLGSLGSSLWANNLFIENVAGERGGAVDFGSDAEVRNNTFLGHAANQGGAVYAGADLDFRNNLVAWTSAGNGLQVSEEGGRYAYNAFFENSAQHHTGPVSPSDSVIGDPRFWGYSPGVGCEADLSLRPDSPLIHAGDPDEQNLDGNRSDIGVHGGPEADPAWWVDNDGDGWPYVYDCDDDDADTFPGAPELCNGKDNDCDGVIDNDPVELLRWYEDADGDGFGNPEVWVESCEQPEGYVDNGDDCDDDDPDTWPGAPEYCNGKDNSCSGVIDGPDPVDGTLWWPDADGDGYGDMDADPVKACEQPEGYVDNDEDCDDSDPNVYPGAPEAENDCLRDAGPGDNGDAGGDGVAIKRGGCNCAVPGTPGGAALLPLLAVLAAFRRRVPGASTEG